MKRQIITFALVAIMILSSVLILIPPVASDGGRSTRSPVADFLLVNDLGDSTTIQSVKTILDNAGHSTEYVSSESNLPSGWDNPDNYPSIFWFGGLSYTSGMPSDSNAGKMVTYVKNGGNVFSAGVGVDSTHYPGNPGTNEQDYLNWVTHHYCGNQWGGGMSGSSSNSYKTTYVQDSNHELFNEPNILPSSWVGDTSYYCIFWYNPSGLLNNGVEIGRASTTSDSRYGDIWVWDGPSYNQNNGRTVLVRHPIRHWSTTTPSGILSDFIENVAAWFARGIPAEVQVKPSNLHFNSNAKYLNVRVLDFPEDPDKSPVDIDGETVKVENVGTFLKFNKNVDSKFMGKVDRQIIMDAIGTPGNQIELEVSGKLNDGTGFSGIVTVKAS